MAVSCLLPLALVGANHSTSDSPVCPTWSLAPTCSRKTDAARATNTLEAARPSTKRDHAKLLATASCVAVSPGAAVAAVATETSNQELRCPSPTRFFRRRPLERSSENRLHPTLKYLPTTMLVRPSTLILAYGLPGLSLVCHPHFPQHPPPTPFSPLPTSFFELLLTKFPLQSLDRFLRTELRSGQRGTTSSFATPDPYRAASKQLCTQRATTPRIQRRLHRLGRSSTRPGPEDQVPNSPFLAIWACVYAW